MADVLVNAFTVAAFVFMLAGVLSAFDFVLILASSLILVKAAPVFH